MPHLVKTRLRGYQVRAATMFYRQKRVALFMQQRTGKTLTVLFVLARLWSNGLIHRVVIDCPKSAISVWEWQIKLHLNIPHTIYVDGKLGPEPKGLQFLLINFERSWRTNTVSQFKPDVFIVDEGHRIKSHTSKQSIAAWELSEECGCEWRADLTGTPSDEDEVDYWAQFRFIDPSIVGDHWPTFEKKYLRKAGYGFYKRRIKKHKKKEFLNKLAPHIFRITRKEALNLPPEEDFIIPFKLTGEAARVYNDLETQLYTEIKDEVVVTPQRVTQLIKLRQATGGFLLNDDVRIRLNQDRLSILADWIQDFRKQKVVIFCCFTEEIEAVKWAIEHSGRTVGVLQGSTKDRTIWRTFQETDEPQTLILQEQAGGVAIEVSVADIGVFYSKSYSYLNHDQCRARLLGRRKKVRFFHFEAENTVDTDIRVVLERKASSTSAVLSTLKQRREKWH